MSESKHTPGPWFENPSFRGSINAEGKHVAMVNCGRTITREEFEANIQLVKAAPELLDAVHALKELLEVDYEPGSEEDDTWLVLIQVDELLSKIKGDCSDTSTPG